jgi:hypothetical protein
MRGRLRFLLIAALLAANTSWAMAQAPGLYSVPPADFQRARPLPEQPAQSVPSSDPMTTNSRAASAQRSPTLAAYVAESPASPGQSQQDEQLADLVQDAADLRTQQAAIQATDAQAQQRQLEILQKQIETQQKMIQLLMEQVKRGPGGASLQRLETQTATLDSRQRQAAQRDQELSAAVDNIVEHEDAYERYGPRLPAQLHELFLPSGTNETPLSIYGALAFGYSKIVGDALNAPAGPRPSTPGGFYFGEFTPDFLLKLNDWILLEAEIGIGADGSVSAGSFAQADFFINDWLTIIAGRIVAPIGWYNERLNNPWINKIPGDAPGGPPLLWLQVLPPLSLLGVEAQGSFYLGCSPIKMEYAAFVSNGLNVTSATPGAPTLDELANLENMTDTFNIITNDKAYGGRIGLWWPAKGLEAGISGMINNDYIAGGFEDSISLWALDFNYRKGNWDFRAEYGMTYQQAADFIGTNIRRQGMYTQIAYRQRDATNKIVQNTELVYRYSYVDFHGIDAKALDLTTYSTPIDVPVRRQQNTFGVNYYFYPRMMMQVAYEINDEPGFHLRDNNFMTQLAWGW